MNRGVVGVLFRLEKLDIFPQPTEELWTTAVRGHNQLGSPATCEKQVHLRDVSSIRSLSR